MIDALRSSVVSELSSAPWAQGVVPVVPGDLPLQLRELLDHRALTRLELGEEADRLVVPRLVVRRMPLDERERTAGLEPARVHVGERLDALSSRGRTSSSATVISSRSR